ncbi:hypothetical protein QJ856_gp0119 [Tupanvirus deep ocean]|uniref:Uncharacterized protein n=2 Tax=Tupanvirus TaxID=2094720 RepID=A0AC62AAA5_9VIRU|nr:hypothetical protein QJ856_gp0119 [Tupanvirus deep ocean]QKU34608.1 hypothetical protein [Tupanvirus deep ocean]
MEQNQFDLNNAVVFNFDSAVGKPDPKQESLADLQGVHTWLASMFSAKCKDYNLRGLSKTIKPDSVVLLDNSVISNKMDATHQGIMQYVFHAWAKELGVVLKPDMFFFTIVSEIKNQIINNPQKYRHLFTVSEKKERIELLNLTIDKLMAALESKIPCKELFSLVTKTTFSTEPSHFKHVMGITMADMGTPYYSYGTTRCGIPKVAVLGSLEDWTNLVNSVTNFRSVFESCCKTLTNYLTVVLGVLEQFVDSVFNAKDGKYLENMFVYYKNPLCGSGHSPIVMDGWLRKLYLGEYYNDNHYGYEDYVNMYPSHLNCLPYDCRDDPNNIEYYTYVCGMSSSRIVDDFLYPEYNIAHCEIVHPEKKCIFDVLASNTQNK